MYCDNYRLLTFSAYDNTTSKKNHEEKNEGDNKDVKHSKNEKEFLVQMFGINEKGKTAAIYVEGFTPFFYIKVGDDWKEEQKFNFILQLKKDMGEYYEGSISESKLIKRKKLYGFDNNKLHTFMLIKFKNESAMKKAKGLWYLKTKSTSVTTTNSSEYIRILNAVTIGIGTMQAYEGILNDKEIESVVHYVFESTNK